MSARTKLEALLQEVGAKLLRRRNHYVYHVPGVGRFVVPASPSDGRAWDNSYARLMRLLGREKPKFRKKRRFHGKKHSEKGGERSKQMSSSDVRDVVAGGLRWKGEREP